MIYKFKLMNKLPIYIALWKDIRHSQYYYHLLNKEEAIALNMFNARSKIIKKDKDVSRLR